MKNFVLFIIGSIMILSLVGCGAKTAGSTGGNIVKNDSGEGRAYDVTLDERTETTQYSYGEDDLSLIDTETGRKITLGMSESEIEEVTGAAEQTDMNDRTYDGVVVRYENGAAVSLIVSSGKFRDGKETRYKTARGVGIGTSAEDFKSAYGDSYAEGEENTDSATGEKSKEASRAVRYFEKDGNKLKFLGTELPKEQKAEDKSNCYMQDFMFSNADGTIATIRVGLLGAYK